MTAVRSMFHRMVARGAGSTILLFLAVVGLGGCASQTPVKAANDGLTVVAENTLASGDAETALRLYREAAIANGGSPKALVRYGQLLFSRGQYDLAAGAFSEALHREPWNKEAMAGLGVAQLADGRLDQAEPNLEQVVRKAADARSVRNLAVLRLLQGQMEEARLLQEKALRRWPQDLDLKSNFALSEAVDERCGPAIDTARAAVASPFARPQHAAAYTLVLAICGQEGEARDVGRGVMSEAGVDALLRQAAQVRQAEDAAGRAAAVGAVPVNASGVTAPERSPRGGGNLP